MPRQIKILLGLSFCLYRIAATRSGDDLVGHLVGCPEVHEGVGAVEEGLQLGGELVPMNRGEDNHAVAGIELQYQGREIIFLDAVRGLLLLAGVAGEADIDLLRRGL